MTLEQFSADVIQILQDRFPRTFGEAQFSVQKINKPGNVVLTGISIRMRHDAIAPIYYVDEYLRNSRTPLDMAVSIAQTIEERSVTSIGSDFITSWASASQHIVPRLIDSRVRGRNTDYLKDRVKTRLVKGIAVIYDVLLPIHTSDDSTASVPVTHQLMSMWRVSPDQIHKKAVENGPTLRPAHFTSMCEMLGLSWDESPDMDILTSSGNYGAAVVLYPGIEQELKNRYDCGAYLLPSSVFEWIIIRKDCGLSVKELQELVSSVNDSDAIAPEDILSDSVYTFKDGVLTELESGW